MAARSRSSSRTSWCVRLRSTACTSARRTRRWRAAELLPESSLLSPVELIAYGGIGSTLLAGSATALQGVLRLIGVQLDLGSMLDALAPNGIGSFEFGAHETLRAAIPAANGLFTARSLARMYATLAGGGELDGVRLLSPATLARATEIQDAPAGRVVIPSTCAGASATTPSRTTRGVPKKAFGHFGFGGSGAWADPRRELAVALIVNSGLGTPFGDTRILRISGAALACASMRSRPPTAPRQSSRRWSTCRPEPAAPRRGLGFGQRTRRPRAGSARRSRRSLPRASFARPARTARSSRSSARRRDARSARSSAASSGRARCCARSSAGRGVSSSTQSSWKSPSFSCTARRRLTAAGPPSPRYGATISSV